MCVLCCFGPITGQKERKFRKKVSSERNKERKIIIKQMNE